MINTLRRRRHVSEDLFYAYWRDTHVAVAARLPGIDTLWTHWVDWDQGRAWPALRGVTTDLAAELRFEGVPEPCFATLEDLQRFGSSMAPLMDDEANIFERTIGYQSLGENSITLKHELDRFPNGELSGIHFLLFLRQRPELATEDFRSGIRAVAERFAPNAAVRKLRLHVLEPYDDTEVFLDANAETVSHGLARDDQHQAVLEIAFADAEGTAAFHGGAAWRESISAQRELCSAIHPFRITRTYTWKTGGKLTLAALRGAGVVDQIRALNALNQVQPETIALFRQTPPELGELQLG